MTLIGGVIFIYSCSHTVKTKEVFRVSKEISNVEHEYMNMAPQLTLWRGPCCQDAQNITNNNNDTAPCDKLTSHMTNLILDNSKILYANKTNRLLLTEELFIKSFKPEFNHSTKANKETSIIEL